MRIDHASLLRRVAGALGPVAGHLVTTCCPAEEASVCRTRLRVTATEWIAGLPALGDVLYLPCRMHCAARKGVAPRMLVESVELAPLQHVQALVAASTITPEGPREWVECLCADGRVMARLYLLPDTDYLAWDALHVATEAPCERGASIDAASWHPTSARLLRFRLRHMAGMQVLGAEAGTGASWLGRTLAARIACEEVAIR